MRVLNKKLKYAIVLTGITVVGLWAGLQMERGRAVLAYNQHNLIRFHVIANSNSVEDQVLKYHVRDAIIKTMARRFKGVQNISEARYIVKNSLDDIGELALSEIKARGFNYPVRVSWGDYSFPTKTYNLGRTEGKTDALTLPAGTYEAVRVVIGEGNGANWWCILFPPLCFIDMSESSESKVSESLPVTSMIKNSDASVRPGFSITESQRDNNDGSVDAEERAIHTFKLATPQLANTKSKHIEIRLKFLELYNDTVTWFSKTLGNGKMKENTLSCTKMAAF